MLSAKGISVINIFASPDINDNSFQIVTSVDIIASVDYMKRIQCILVN